MQQITTALVLGANRYKVERQTGGYLYLLEPGDHENPDALGLGIRKVKMPYEMYDQLRDKRVPAVFDVLTEAERAGQEADNEIAVSVRGDGKLTAETLNELFGISASAKAPGKVPDQPLQGAAYALVIAASRFEAEDGRRYSNIVISQKTSGRNPNQLGFEIIRIPIAWDLFAAFQAKGLPGEYKLLTSLRSGSGFKARLKVDGVEGENYLDQTRLHQLFGVQPQQPQAPRPANPEAPAKPA